MLLVLAGGGAVLADRVRAAEAAAGGALDGDFTGRAALPMIRAPHWLQVSFCVMHALYAMLALHAIIDYAACMPTATPPASSEEAVIIQIRGMDPAVVRSMKVECAMENVTFATLLAPCGAPTSRSSTPPPSQQLPFAARAAGTE